MRTADQIAALIDTKRQASHERDAAMADVLAIRNGNWDEVAPGLFPKNFPKPIVANFIDVTARDIASVIAPLPGFKCTSGQMGTDTARKRADKRTQIVKGAYIDGSNLQAQMLTAVDRMLSYGFMAFMVEPDFKQKQPVIFADNQFGAYYQLDRMGRHTLFYAQVFRAPLDQLMWQYPEKADALQGYYGACDNRMVEYARYYDCDQSSLIELESKITLMTAPNPTERCPVVVVELPHVGMSTRGQFDDVVWIQMARAKMALYALQGAEKSINAPIVYPDDVQEAVYGPDAIIRTANPDGVGRVQLDVPQAVFAEAATLQDELRTGSRYPAGRSGNIDASIITGQGVEALMGTFSTQTQTCQLQLANALQDVVALCFEMDEKLFGRAVKTVRGNDAGSPYVVTYTPSADIAHDYTCNVTYGLTAGLDPNRALIFILQAKTAGLLSMDTAMRALPVDIEVESEKAKIDIENEEIALGMAIASLAQMIPMAAQQGGDPSATIRQINAVIEARGKGKSMSEAVAIAFPPPPPPDPQEAGDPASAGGDPLAALLGSAGGAGAIPAPNPGDQASGANGLLMSVAGLSPSGQPQMGSTVSNRQPVR